LGKGDVVAGYEGEDAVEAGKLVEEQRETYHLSAEPEGCQVEEGLWSVNKRPPLLSACMTYSRPREPQP
jgi:hypothetical protein